MLPLEKTLRNKLERTVRDARDIAETAAKAVLEQLGVGEAAPFTHLSEDEKILRRKLRVHGRQLGDSLNSGKVQTMDRLIEEVAYEHWHRMLFARFLAENNLLMYPDPDNPVAVSLEECEDLAADEGAKNGWELAARFAARMLPQIFRTDSPVFQLQFAADHQLPLEKLLADLPQEVFTASDSLGWVYQFWQAKKKDEVNASEKKIGADELAAVTQLFTEDYMVIFLLHNTLGAWWAGKVLAAKPQLADSAMSEVEVRTACSVRDIEWPYLRFVKEGENGSWMPAAGIFYGWPKAAKDITILDPCMGSGHFLVFALPILVAFRMTEEGLTEGVAIDAVLRDNLFGLEVDARCTKIAAFNLALAAWRRIGYYPLPAMHLACSGLGVTAKKEDWLALVSKSDQLQNGMERLFHLFLKAPILGSLINPSILGGDLLMAEFHDLQPFMERALKLETTDETHELAVTAKGIAEASVILSMKFTLVITNVPYLGRGKQDNVLKDYCERVHPKAKADLATCFVERCLSFCSHDGTSSLVTPQNWLFLGKDEEMRISLIETKQWNIVAKLGPKSFQTPMWDFNVMLIAMTHAIPNRSHQFAGIDVSENKTPKEKESALISGSVECIGQLRQLENPDAAIQFSNESNMLPLLGEYAEVFQGVGTTDNSRFLVKFWELSYVSQDWDYFQMSPHLDGDFSGCSGLLHWEKGNGALSKIGTAHKGLKAYGKFGFAVAVTRGLNFTHFLGVRFDNTIAVLR